MKTRRFPSRSSRGLGLFDTIVAFGVFSLVLLWGSQILGNWIAGQAIANDARSVAELARAGRLLIEGDITHSGRGHTQGAAPDGIALSELVTAGLRSPVLGERTPGRRDLTLWLYKPSANVLLIMARARGETEVTRIPGAEDGVSGVGALLQDEDDTASTEHLLHGPGISYDMFPINTADSRFATKEDIFALEYVALDVTCRTYLYRVEADCDGDGTDDPEANTMTVDLDMDGNNLTNVGTLETHSATIAELHGHTRIEGDLTVGGDLSWWERIELPDNVDFKIDINGTLSAANVTIENQLTVNEQLRVEGDLTGQNLQFHNATISGTAKVDRLNITEMETVELKADRIDIETGEITNLSAEDLTVTTCSGCNP